MPTYLQSQKTLCLIKAGNGYVVAPERNSPPEQCLFFATLDEAMACLATNWTA